MPDAVTAWPVAGFMLVHKESRTDRRKKFGSLILLRDDVKSDPL